jgi:hypothetical protein
MYAREACKVGKQPVAIKLEKRVKIKYDPSEVTEGYNVPYDVAGCEPQHAT